jgi:hypothetical protein
MVSTAAAFPLRDYVYARLGEGWQRQIYRLAAIVFVVTSFFLIGLNYPCVQNCPSE